MAFALKLLGIPRIERDGLPVTGRASQRRRLALLARLAGGGDRGVARDRLVDLLWPGAAVEQGRHLLSDSAYRINQALGREAVRVTGDVVRLDAAILSSDVTAFEAALSAGDPAAAIAVYGGPFLDGLQISDAPEFAIWVDGERERLRQLWLAALEALAERLERDGQVAPALGWWRQLAAADPYNSRVALRLIQALVAVGERATAIRHGQAHAALLAADLEVEPEPELVRYVESLRTAPPEARPAAPPREPQPAAAAESARSPAATLPPPVPPPGERRRKRSARAGWAWAGAGLVALLGGLLFFRLAASHPDSIAVLPFTDLSPTHDYEYLGDGIAEELISTLADLPGLRVVARTSSFSFKGQPTDIRAIGRRLRVEAVVEGSVRREGNRLRVAARLVDVADGYELWSETYDRETGDVIRVQDEIAQAIGRRLRRPAPVDTGPAAPRPAPEAYNLYLQGRYAWHQRTAESLRRSADYFERATALAPQWAPGWVGLGDALAVMGFYDYLPPDQAFPRAVEAARRALVLDPANAPAQSTLGYAALYYDWDFSQSERAFQRAIALDSTYSTAHQWYANLLTAMGRFDEAEREMKRAMELDPLSLIANAALGWVYYHAERYPDAIAQLHRTLQLNPDFQLAYLWLGMSYEQWGRQDSAAIMLDQAVERAKGTPLTMAARAHLYATAGDTARARRLLHDLSRSGDYLPSYEIGRTWLAVGDTAAAMSWLNRARWERSHSMVFLAVDPQWQPLGRRVSTGR